MDSVSKVYNYNASQSAICQNKNKLRTKRRKSIFCTETKIKPGLASISNDKAYLAGQYGINDSNVNACIPFE